MSCKQLAAKATDIVRASKGQPSGLPDNVQKVCKTYGQIKSQLRLQLLPGSGAYRGYTAVLAQGSLECATEPGTGVLVFCSATRPGGGWLTGAAAQEEAISRASTWALSCGHPQFHSDKGNDGYFYKNAVVSVAGKILERNNTLLAKPALVHFVGMCAPNARAMEERNLHPESPAVRKKIIEALVFRMRLSLQAFAQAGCTRVVLGAVGCGVFRVRPDDCVEAWSRALQLDGAPFEHIMFGLGPDPSQEIKEAFLVLEKRVVSELARGPGKRS